MANAAWYIEQKIEVTNAILLRIERILMEIRNEARERGNG